MFKKSEELKEIDKDIELCANTIVESNVRLPSVEKALLTARVKRLELVTEEILNQLSGLADAITEIKI